MNENKIGIYRIKLKTKPVQDGKMQQQDVFKYCKDNNIIGLGWEIPDQFKSKTLKIEDAIQSNSEKGSIGLINSIAELFVDDKITLEQAKAQIEEKNLEILNRTIMQLKIKRDSGMKY